MPGEDLIVPGFHGKLPAAGDFVSRRLPADFVRGWDRWVARHLAGRMTGEDAVCFVLAAPPGPAAGVAVASRDRAGRRFPLTLAAPLPAGVPSPADGWFARLAAAAREAVDDGVTPEALDRALSGLALAASAAGSAPGVALLLWTPGERPRAAPPDAPGRVLDLLLRPVGGRD